MNKKLDRNIIINIHGKRKKKHKYICVLTLLDKKITNSVKKIKKKNNYDFFILTLKIYDNTIYNNNNRLFF